jgi:hypothetical protein
MKKKQQVNIKVTVIETWIFQLNSILAKRFYWTVRYSNKRRRIHNVNTYDFLNDYDYSFMSTTTK